jgi:putative transposase
VAVALYAAGVSQRKAAEVMSFLLGHRYSHETISAMTEEVLQAVEAFRRRPLPEEMAFVYLDGLYLKLLREGEGVVREVVYVALGVTPCGERQVLGYWLLPAESALGWEGVLGELWPRGLRRVRLFITDGLPGLPSGGVAAVRGARGAVEPGAGAGQRPDPLSGRPEAGVRGGEPGGGAQGPGGFEGGLGFAVPGGGGPVGWGLGGLSAVLRLPQGALAVLAEHQPDGEVHSGDSAGNEGEGSGRRPILPTSFPARRRCTSSCTWSRRGKLLREANILRLKGFSEARETLEKMLQERYAPRTQTLTHTS